MQVKELKDILDRCIENGEIRCYVREHGKFNSYMETFYPIVRVHIDNDNRRIILDLNYAEDV